MLRILLCILICAGFSFAQIPEVVLEPVLTGLELPVYAASAHDASGRLFIVSLAGQIYILEDEGLIAEPFMSLAGLVTAQEGEQGLFSIAFHPEYEDNRQFYVSYTEAGTGELVVMAHETLEDDPNRADPDRPRNYPL